MGLESGAKGAFKMVICTIPYSSFATCEYMKPGPGELVLCKGRNLFESGCPNRKIVEDAPEEEHESGKTDYNKR
jgi:hypothetical protein